jgi:hypothetical protein
MGKLWTLVFGGLRVSGENTTCPEARSVWKAHWKRILLIAILFVILVVSLFYFVLPNVLYPLRIDPIPAGAYVVPWIEPNPSLAVLTTYQQNSSGPPPPYNIDSIMAGALKLNMAFNISVAGGNRVIPSTVYLGHDMDYLYVGGEFRGMGLNPNNGPNVTLPNYFNILFDVKDDGTLTFPEAGSQLTMCVYNDCWTTEGLYNDLLWSYESDVQRTCWGIAAGYYFPNAPPAITLAAGFAEYNPPTGTLTIIFARCLRLSAVSEIDALQMRPGERWVMGFVLELGFGRYVSGETFADNMDGWPRNVYPYLSNDSSWWPKLVIDLTKQPATFLGQNAAGSD